MSAAGTLGLQPGDAKRNFGIDLLRVLAVSMVMVYHTLGGQSNLLGRLGGAGWMGVDLFFVMSGFLVTRSFLGQAQQGELAEGALGVYYRRRAKRIIPAYLVVVVAVTLIGLAIPPLRGRALRELPFYLTFTANWTEIVAVVLWSISVEVQFYAFLPALGVGRAGHRIADWVGRHPVVSLSLALSLPVAYRALLYALHPEVASWCPQPLAPGVQPRSLSGAFGARIYGSTLGHMDGLLLGAWLGIQWLREPRLAGLVRHLGDSVMVLGGAIFGGAYLALAPWRTWMPRPWVTGVFGFTAVAFGALLLVAGAASTLERPARDSALTRAIQWGSDRIYSLYLAQALVSVLTGMLVAWSNLSVAGGLMVTALYLLMTIHIGRFLYSVVERRFWGGLDLPLKLRRNPSCP